jgi:splicing factor U2AF 65 kDa subunit
MWDVKPEGYENVTAEQAKMSGIAFKSRTLILGLFPLPGAPRNPTGITEASLQALADGKPIVPPPALAPLEVPKLWALNASSSRQARRLVISKLPPASTAAEIQDYLNTFTTRLNIYKEGSGEAVKDVKKATSGGVALVEFAESVYATTVLALEDDVEFMGVALEVRRPTEYIVMPPDKDLQLETDSVSKDVPDSSEKILIKGLPVYLTSEQGMELVEAFGALQGWMLITETDSNESKVRGLHLR